MRVVNRRELEICATPDGDWRHLVSFNAERSSTVPGGYSLDRKSFFYVDKDSAGKDSLFRISTEGGQPERLGDLPEQYQWADGFIRVSPDGRNVLVVGNNGSLTEAWLLENFEPKPPAAK